MKTSLVFTWEEDHIEGAGYVRANRRVDPEWRDNLMPVFQGRLAAHDFVEHIGGNSSGTVEDEIAAYGVMAVTRLQAGMIGNWRYAGDAMLADEINEMIDMYGERIDLGDGNYTFGIQPRNRTNQCHTDVEWIAETAAGGNKRLARHIEAWIQLGIRHMRQRFGSDMEALDLFQNIANVFDTAVENYNPYQLAIRIDGACVWSEILKMEAP